MKKLLLLGGSRYILPIIKKAHELGIYVITCDYLPDNIAHKYSDEYCNVSIIEQDKVLELAKEKNIDGILSFACDPGVVTAAYVAEKLGLPSCGSYESVSILQNKGLFRKFLKDHNFNTPNARSYFNVKDALKDVDYFNWPVIVKPVDSAGSKGVSRVDNKEDLNDAFLNAVKFSKTNEVIIEDFLEKKGDSSDCDCFSIDGKLASVNFSAQGFDANCANPYTPAYYLWPSTISEENKTILSNEIQRLITLLNLKTSIYNVEVRECTNGKPYIMELSPRGGGNRLAEMVKHVNGVDMIENTVRYSVGLPLIEMKEKESSFIAEVILHSEHDGIYDSISIDDSVKSNVIETDLWIEKGTHVGGFAGANEAIGTLVFKFEDFDKLNDFRNNINSFVKVNLKK